MLITGIAGFCGSHLAELLLEQQLEIFGVELASFSTDNLSALLSRIDLRQADLRDGDHVRRILEDIRPDLVFHLAALTGPKAGNGYEDLYKVNLFGTMNLLEAIETEGLDCRVLIAGSSAQYGLVPPEENPILETHPFRPVTHYAVSKAAQDLLGYCYWAAKGLAVIRARSFNIIGPRQTAGFVGSAFAKQLAEIEQGMREPIIEVGNLDAQRDFIDVRDAVRAYRLALLHGEPGHVYNVCSGKPRPIRDLLDGLLALSTVRGIEVHQVSARLQVADVRVQAGDYSRLHQLAGWQPEIPFERALHDLLDYWRGLVAKETL